MPQYASAPYGRHPQNVPQQEYVDVAGTVGQEVKDAGALFNEMVQERVKSQEAARKYEDAQAQQEVENKRAELTSKIAAEKEQREQTKYDRETQIEDKKREDLKSYHEGLVQLKQKYDMAPPKKPLSKSEARRQTVDRELEHISLLRSTNQIDPAKAIELTEKLTREPTDYFGRAYASQRAKKPIQNDLELQAAQANLDKLNLELDRFTEDPSYMGGVDESHYKTLNQRKQMIVKAIVDYQTDKGKVDTAIDPLNVTAEQESTAKELLHQLKTLNESNKARRDAINAKRNR